MRNSTITIDQVSDSIWALIGGFAKNYNVPVDYVLHEISFTNFHLYGMIEPSISSEDEAVEEEINADDKANEDIIEKIIKG